MNALATKYTEETYLTYEELKEKFLPAQMEAIWREVANYRELFVVDLLNQQFIVHSMQLQKKHAKTESLLNRILREGGYQPVNFEQIGISNEVIQCIKNKYQSQYSHSLQAICKELQMEYSELMKFLDHTELPLMIQIYLILTQTQGWMQRILFLYLSYEECCHDVMFLLAETQCRQELRNDQTKAYESWLHDVHQLLHQQLIIQRANRNVSYLKELRLLERYPALKPYQAEFFEHHRSAGHYYTVEQFLLYCNTCYETARMSMEEFVRLGWYKKEKCGKKYIYYVVN